MDEFKVITGYTPRPHQAEAMKEIWKICREREAPNLLVKLPCGYGKTELAVVPFLSQWFRNDFLIAPRLIYALPMRILCNQVKDRIETWAKGVEAISNKRIIVKLQHGGALEDPFLFADVSVTTLDYVLYAYVRETPLVGHRLDIPAGCLAVSYVVLDEAHMYSSFTHALVRVLIKILSRARIPFLVMTATMPSTLENQLFDGVECLQRIEYDEKKHLMATERNLSYKVVDEQILRNASVNPKIVSLLKGDEFQKALIVLNTVGRAQEVFRKLKQHKIDATLLHSRFTHIDRSKREKEVINSVGKRGIGKGVIVSTQVCETGLDISCDCLMTECAPADSLVQRFGRIARWGGEGKIYIFRPQSHHPYSEEWVNTTLNTLKAKSFDFTRWRDTMLFVNGMKYTIDEEKVSRYVRELINATMFASKPGAFHVRESSNIYVVVSQRLAQEGERLLKDVKQMNDLLKERTVPVLWRMRGVENALCTKNSSFLEITYDERSNEYKFKETHELLPFHRYLGKVESYSNSEGLKV